MNSMRRHGSPALSIQASLRGRSWFKHLPQKPSCKWLLAKWGSWAPGINLHVPQKASLVPLFKSQVSEGGVQLACPCAHLLPEEHKASSPSSIRPCPPGLCLSPWVSLAYFPSQAWFPPQVLVNSLSPKPDLVSEACNPRTTSGIIMNFISLICKMGVIASSNYRY